MTLTTVKRFRARDARKRRPKPHILTLGSAHFRMNVNRRVSATVRLSRTALTKLGKATSTRVLIIVRNHSSKGVTGMITRRTVTLVLRRPQHRRH